MDNAVKTGFRLLMVDDSPEDVFFVRRALQKSGVGQFFHGVPDVPEAIAYLRGEGLYAQRQQFPFPNVLLVDLKLPGLSGFDLLEWLQHHPECQVIPTIAFSSSCLQRDVHQAYRLGANAFITKPSELKDFTGFIQTTYDFWSRCQMPPP